MTTNQSTETAIKYADITPGMVIETTYPGGQYVRRTETVLAVTVSSTGWTTVTTTRGGYADYSHGRFAYGRTR